jgi:hypothetical protein
MNTKDFVFVMFVLSMLGGGYYVNSLHNKHKLYKFKNPFYQEFIADSIHGVIRSKILFLVEDEKCAKVFVPNREKRILVFTKAKFISEGKSIQAYNYLKIGDSIWKKPNDTLFYSKRGDEIIKWEVIQPK